MSYDSVFSVIGPLLQNGIPELLTVADADQVDTALVPPNLCPCVLLRARPMPEEPIALGLADSCWWLDCTLWAYYLPPQDLLTDPTLQDWRGLVQQLEAVLRQNLGSGVADDALYGTKVYVSGRELQKQNLPNLNTGLGQIARRTRRSSMIREAVALSTPF